MHEAGVAQKIVIAACHSSKALPFMYSFLMKLKSYEFAMSGGILDGMVKLQQKNQRKDLRKE